MDVEKAAKYNRMMDEYTRMGAEIHQLGVDLGIEETVHTEISEKYRPEFEALLCPAGYYVFDIKKIVSGNLDEFMVYLGRRGQEGSI